MDVADNLHAVRQRELSRRRVSKILLAAGVGVATVPASPARAQGGPQGSYFTWGGDIPELFGPYERKNGALPDSAVFGGTEEALLKMRGGFVVDVAYPCNAGLLRWIVPSGRLPAGGGALTVAIRPERIALSGDRPCGEAVEGVVASRIYPSERSLFTCGSRAAGIRGRATRCSSRDSARRRRSGARVTAPMIA